MLLKGEGGVGATSGDGFLVSRTHGTTFLEIYSAREYSYRINERCETNGLT